MAKSLLKRLEWWLAKTEPDMVHQRLKALREAMRRHYEAEQAALWEVETRVRQVLHSADLPSILYPFYLDFGREVFARKRRLAPARGQFPGAGGAGALGEVGFTGAGPGVVESGAGWGAVGARTRGRIGQGCCP